MQLNIFLGFSVSLTNEEFHMISRALRGMLRPEEKEAAAALQTEMMKAKSSRIKHLNSEMEKLDRNIQLNEG